MNKMFTPTHLIAHLPYALLPAGLQIMLDGHNVYHIINYTYRLAAMLLAQNICNLVQLDRPLLTQRLHASVIASGHKFGLLPT